MRSMFACQDAPAVDPLALSLACPTCRRTVLPVTDGMGHLEDWCCRCHTLRPVPTRYANAGLQLAHAVAEGLALMAVA